MNSCFDLENDRHHRLQFMEIISIDAHSNSTARIFLFVE